MTAPSTWGIVTAPSTEKGRYMANKKQSARQVTDAAAAVIAAPKVDALVNAPLKMKPRGGKPEGFTGDRPGWFRGVRIKR